MQGAYQTYQQPYPQAPAPVYQPIAPRKPPAGMFYWVRGFAEADNWPIANGETALMLDELENVMYIRTHDKRGMPVTIVYDTTERVPPQPVDMSRLEQMVVGIIERRYGQQKQHQQEQEVTENAQQDV